MACQRSWSDDPYCDENRYAGGVAAKYIAQDDLCAVGLVGYTQTETQLMDFLTAKRKLEEIGVWDRTAMSKKNHL